MRLIIFLLLNISTYIYGQVGINTNEPQAMLDVVSENDGVLFPRLSAAQINQIQNIEEGLLLYNTTEHCLQIYNGIAWNCLEFSQPKITDKIIDKDKAVIDSHISPEELHEISGLHYLGSDFFLAHNDGENKLYKIQGSEPYNVVQTYQLGINIRDWEAITLSDDFVFIGDFGNNYARENVNKIYYFPIDELRKKGEVVNINNIKSFNFNYPEQVNFNLGLNETDFDTEAFVFINGDLHLFTKEWVTKGTAHYKIPFMPDMPSQAANFIERYETGFLVTDAAYVKSPNKHHLFLVGYNSTPFSSIYMNQFSSNIPDSFFNNSSIIQLEKGSVLGLGQVEGIAVKYYSAENKEICYGSEGINNGFINIVSKISCIKFN
ncbi:MAG: hypothetical protein ACR2MS_00765 [Weeksellaceae bacterium]